MPAVTAERFYGPVQAAIHHEDFGRLAGWAAADVVALLRAAGLREGTAVDLGCGSGILAGELVGAGYGVVGVDVSPAMVVLARAHAPGAAFAVGSLWDADLPAGCVAVTAVGEALNYASAPADGSEGAGAGTEALAGLAARVRRALAPGGVFVFDVATPGRNGRDLVRHQFHDRERWTLYMRAEEHPDRRTLERAITTFDRRPDGSYGRSDEHHTLVLYEPGEVVALLADAGFDVDPRDDYEAAPTGGAPPGWRAFVARRPPG